MFYLTDHFWQFYHHRPSANVQLNDEENEEKKNVLFAFDKYVASSSSSSS